MHWRPHKSMEFYVVVEEEGEYSYKDWKIAAIFNEKYEALRFAWLAIMDNFNKEMHIECWDLRISNTSPTRKYDLYSTKLLNDMYKDGTKTTLDALREQLKTTVPRVGGAT